MYTEVKTVHDVGKSLAEIHKTLKASSLLARRSSLQVDASVEARSEQQDRIHREEVEARNRHDRLAQRLLPTATPSGQPEEAQDAGTQRSLSTLWKRFPHTARSLLKRSSSASCHFAGGLSARKAPIDSSQSASGRLSSSSRRQNARSFGSATPGRICSARNAIDYPERGYWFLCGFQHWYGPCVCRSKCGPI